MIFNIFKRIIIDTIEKEKELNNIEQSSIIYFNSSINNYTTRNKIGIIAKNITEERLSYILKKTYINLKREIIRRNLDIFMDNDNNIINGIDFTFFQDKIPSNILDKKEIEDFLYLSSNNIRTVENSWKFLNSNFVDTDIINRNNFKEKEKIFLIEEKNYKAKRNTEISFI